MAYKIAIASGKGGTGKTTLSVNLYNYLSKKIGKNIQLVDCDVEEPNDAIFFSEIKREKQIEVNQLIPKIDINTCSFCRSCVEYCEFNAIVIIPSVDFAEVNKNLCHSCGACSVTCKTGSITEVAESIGHVNFYDINQGKGLIEGKLKIGSAMQTMLIKELKKEADPENTITLYDAPPGTSCPVVETTSDADFVVLVTEPTPFGLHDLKLMVELMNELQKQFGVVINKAGLGNNDVYKYLEEQNIELLGEIPFMRNYTSNYARGNLFNDIPKEIERNLLDIASKLEKKIQNS